MVAEVIQQKTGKVFYWFGLLLIFWLPLDNSFIPLLSFLWLFSGLVWIIISVFFTKQRILQKNNVKNSYLLLFVALYVLHIISVVYSENQSSAFFGLEIKLPLLFFPVFSVVMLTVNTQKRLDNLLMAFVFGNLTAILIDFSMAFFGHEQIHISNFFYRDLSYFHHPSYFALYLAFSLAVLLFRFIPRYNLRESLKGNLLLILSIIFFGFVILLSSRAGIIALLVIPVLKIIQLLSLSKMHRLYKMGIVLLTILVMILLAATNSRVQKAYQSFTGTFNIEEIEDQEDLSSAQTRVIIWKSSLELIKENWLFGIGNGDVKQEIHRQSNEILGNENQLKRHYNAHNQYLDTFLAIGITGLIILLVIILWPGIYAVRKKDYLVLSIVLLIIIHFSFESMINRQAGVIFLSFFLPVLFYYSNPGKKDY